MNHKAGFWVRSDVAEAMSFYDQHYDIIVKHFLKPQKKEALLEFHWVKFVVFATSDHLKSVSDLTLMQYPRHWEIKRYSLHMSATHAISVSATV